MSLFMVLGIVTAACSSDDDKFDILQRTAIQSVQDPEGTIVLNMHQDGGSYGYYTLGFNYNNDGGYSFVFQFDLKINSANNFQTYSGYTEIVSVGSVSGLSGVVQAPRNGWATSAAVVPGTGYVLRFKNPNTEKNYYMRLYVVDYITNTSGGIIGATVKYQCPWESPLVN